MPSFWLGSVSYTDKTLVQCERGLSRVNTRVWGSLQATLEAGKLSKYKKRCENSWVTRKHEKHSLTQCFPVFFTLWQTWKMMLFIQQAHVKGWV